ncbi:hypothetical protein SCD_n00828 [Sulfuricella denitrificans skB26]|uniref:Molecular chaperone n=1 Tax=Sulfuricella denitrificans (strain DSM 22764 / NBRC 105220 / skB26) TaxID=1163617 RepID=S6AJG8_SULDS|nr:hypothetical protein [Sulfuricella denitrificans]BAN34669.1 hypothetical protein SCD_n00828 [Sulfuricella denitrificans skB26]
MSLTLTVPAIDPVEDLTVETRPKHLKEWLDDLPLTNLSDVCRTLDDEIGAMNRQKVAMETRLKLLELYRSVIFKLLPAMEEQYVATRLPQPGKNRQMAEQARQLLMELANGYKIILLDYQNARITLGKGKIAVTAAQRAMSALSRILMICYQTYAPAPAGIWFEIHQIFRFAIEQDIANETITDEESESSSNLVYKQTLLLALSNPYHLSPGEVAWIQNYLTAFGGLAQLQAFAHTGNSIGLFLAETHSDKPPKPLPQDLNEVDNRSDILLNTLELVHALHHHIARLNDGELPKNMQLPFVAKETSYRDLLKSLLKNWSAAPKRVFNRTQNISSTQVCIGLPSLHHFLGGRESGASTDLTSIQTANNQRFISSRWLVINEGAGGLALCGTFESLPQIRPGDVIGLKADEANQWNVGAVRWVKSDKADQLEIGTQLIAPKAEPARIKPSIASPAETFQAALLLPEILMLRQPETLIAPRGTFGPQRELLLELDGHTTQAIRAVKLVEQTAGYERFEFSRG